MGKKTYATSPGDFRDGAVAASERALAEAARLQPALIQDPFQAGNSLCLRAPGDGEAARRRLRRRVLVYVVAGITGIAFGGILAKASESKRLPFQVSDNALLTAAAVCSGGGFLLMFLGVSEIKRVARRTIAARVRFERGVTLLDVEIEDANTYSTMKAVPEDVGILVMYPAEQCIIIEGMTHRYLIHASDVLNLRDVAGPSSKAAGIAYSAAGMALDITVKQQGLWPELYARMTPWAGSRLRKRLLAVFANS